MARKRNVMLTLDPTVVEQAKAFDLNLSQIAEGALRDAIAAEREMRENRDRRQGELYLRGAQNVVTMPADQRPASPEAIEMPADVAGLAAEDRAYYRAGTADAWSYLQHIA